MQDCDLAAASRGHDARSIARALSVSRGIVKRGSAAGMAEAPTLGEPKRPNRTGSGAGRCPRRARAPGANALSLGSAKTMTDTRLCLPAFRPPLGALDQRGSPMVYRVPSRGSAGSNARAFALRATAPYRVVRLTTND